MKSNSNFFDRLFSIDLKNWKKKQNKKLFIFQIQVVSFYFVLSFCTCKSIFVYSYWINEKFCCVKMDTNNQFPANLAGQSALHCPLCECDWFFLCLLIHFTFFVWHRKFQWISYNVLESKLNSFVEENASENRVSIFLNFCCSPF